MQKTAMKKRKIDGKLIFYIGFMAFPVLSL